MQGLGFGPDDLQSKLYRPYNTVNALNKYQGRIAANGIPWTFSSYIYIHTHTHIYIYIYVYETHTHIYIYIYIYIYKYTYSTGGAQNKIPIIKAVPVLNAGSGRRPSVSQRL